MATRKKVAATAKAPVKNRPAPGAKKIKQAPRKRPSPPAEPSSIPTVTTDIPHDEIAARDYMIYVNAGCPAGMELQHWLEAEAQLRGH